MLKSKKSKLDLQPESVGFTSSDVARICGVSLRGVGSRRAGDGQPDDEGRSGRQLARHRDLTPVILGDVTHDGEAQTAAKAVAV